LRREAIQPVGIGMTKDGKTAFIALGPANRIAVVDAASHAVTKYLLSASGSGTWHSPRRKIPAGDQRRLQRRLGDRCRRAKVIKTIRSANFLGHHDCAAMTATDAHISGLIAPDTPPGRIPPHARAVRCRRQP